MAYRRPNSIEQTAELLGTTPDHVPTSIAIIMDGNGRWAQKRGLPRTAGHREGAKRVRPIVTEAAGLGVKALALYSFSIENWNRPKREIELLMHLYADYLRRERPTIIENNLRLRHLGRASSGTSALEKSAPLCYCLRPFRQGIHSARSRSGHR